MNKEKLNVVNNLFEGKQIRSIWDTEKEDYYFSVVDVVKVLTDSPNPRNYWSMLKRKLTLEEKSQLYTNCVQLKLESQDGKFYSTDVLDTEGIFRLIESIPSKKAEPFKLWLAKLGRQEIDNVFDPSLGIDKMINYYISKGYTLEWIEARIKAIINRKKLMHTWKDSGIKNDVEYAILTNEIYKSWSGMSAREYKMYKNIRKESLRDNMTDIEVALADLGEIATRELVKEYKPTNFEENRKIASAGGGVAKSARNDLEEKLGHKVISNSNTLSYTYENKEKMLDNH